MKKLYTLLAAGLLCTLHATAQETGTPGSDLDDFYTGAIVGDVALDNITEDTYNYPHEGCVLLYNVGAKKVMSLGGRWGTKATIGESGARVWIQKKSIIIPTGEESINVSGGEPEEGEKQTAYVIRTIVGSTQGSSLAFIQSPDQYKETHGGIYLDRDPNNGSTSASVQFLYLIWSFVPVAGESTEGGALNSYYIRPARKRTGDMVSVPEPNQYLYFDPNDPEKPVTAGALPEGLASSYAQWRLLTPETVNNIMDNTYADGRTPADATIYVLDWNLSSHNIFLKHWKWQSEDGTIVTPEQKIEGGKYAVGSYDAAGRDMTWGAAGEQGKYGKYTCGSIMGRGRFYQVLSLPRSGWYRIDCQAFGANAQLFAFTGKAGESEPENSVIISPSNNYTVLKQKQGMPVNRNTLEAAQTFATGIYPNHVLFYVDVPEGQRAPVTIGIRTTDDFTAGRDTICFDDFQLKYMGKNNTEYKLSESHTQTDTIQGMQANTLYNVHIEYTSNVEKWNALTLPFSLTKDQFMTAFGTRSMISELKDFTRNVVHFESIDLQSKNNDDIVAQAGHSYLVWIARNGYTNNYVFTRLEPNLNPGEGESEWIEKKLTVHAPYYTIPGVYLTEEQKAHLLDLHPVTTDESNEEYGRFTFVGSFTKQQITDSIYYALYRGDWYSFTYDAANPESKARTTRGFRGWLTYEKGTSETSSFDIFMDGIEDDELTSIFVPKATDTQTTARGIYDLNGRRMDANSTKQLPRGIYIVNGRKYIK